MVFVCRATVVFFAISLLDSLFLKNFRFLCDENNLNYVVGEDEYYDDYYEEDHGESGLGYNTVSFTAVIFVIVNCLYSHGKFEGRYRCR